MNGIIMYMGLLLGSNNIRGKDTGSGKDRKMKNKKEVVSTQIRLPAGIHEYIKQEADRMGIAQNAFLVVLLERGKKMWEAETIIRPRE